MELTRKIPGKLLEAYNSVAKLDVGTELDLEISKFQWCVHYAACCAWANEVKDVAGNDRYLVIEGHLDFARKNRLINRWLPIEMRRSEYEPDLIRTAINEGGRHHFERDIGKLVIENAKIVEVAVCWAGHPELSWARKLNKLKQWYTPDQIELVVVDIDGVIYTESKSYGTGEQHISLINAILQLTCELSLGQRNIILSKLGEKSSLTPYLERPSFFRFNLIPDKMNQNDLQAIEAQIEKCSQPMLRRAVFPELTRADKKPLIDETSPPIKWKGFCPFYNRPIPIGSSDFGFQHTIEVVRKLGIPLVQHTRGNDFYSILREFCAEKKESIDVSPAGERIFGIGKRAESKRWLQIEKPSMLHNSRPELKSFHPWIDRGIEWLSQPSGILVELPVQDAAYNSADVEFLNISKRIAEVCGRPWAALIPEVVENMALRLASYTFNTYDGMSLYPLLGHNHLWGFCVKGPAHPRKDSDRVPFLLFQFMEDTPSFHKFYMEGLTNNQVLFNWPEDGRLVLATQCGWWPAKIRSMMSATRVIIQMAGETLELLRGKFVDERGNTNWVSASESDTMTRKSSLYAAEDVCSMLQSNIQLEGFLANFRRLYHMSVAAVENRTILQHPGADPEGKSEEAISDNCMCFYFAWHYNQSLRVYANSALALTGGCGLACIAATKIYPEG